MKNPYSHETPAPSTPEAQRRADYEAAIGPNSGYYLKYFEQFDAGESKAGWNWSAFLLPPWWCIYRKLWLAGILGLVWPWILGLTLLIPYAFSRPPLVLTVGIGAVLLVTPYILLAVFANSLYWRHVQGLIRQLPKSVAAVPEKRLARLERNGGTGVGPVFAVAGVGAFLIVVVGGIVAIYTIQVRQQYQVREQIVEGLKLADSARADVARYYALKRAWPEQSDLGTAPLSGRYVSSVVVKKGSVVITFGNEAIPALLGTKLALLPGVTRSGNVVWTCGNRSLPYGLESGTGPSGTDLFDEFLPSDCRTY